MIISHAKIPSDLKKSNYKQMKCPSEWLLTQGDDYQRAFSRIEFGTGYLTN
jgi:hypothetical protein